MASVIDDPNGRRRVQFVEEDGSRPSIRLGKIDRRSAESIKRHVEALHSAKVNGQPLLPETATWMKTIGNKLRDKLEAVGLIEPIKRAALGEFLRTTVLNRPDVKPATLEVWQQPVRNLILFFGETRSLREITPRDADRFKAWILTQKLAPTTIAKRLAFARTFFHAAKRNKLIDENPFADVKIPNADVSKRQAFVSRETIAKIMAVADPTWRTIIALSRFGGLRCPTEVLLLEWKHIDWERKRITVTSPKTERYDGKESRMMPLYDDLIPYLEEAEANRQPGQTHVVGGNYLANANQKGGWRSCNLNTRMKRLIKRAGLEVWPKVFHNLRSSREQNYSIRLHHSPSPNGWGTIRSLY